MTQGLGYERESLEQNDLGFLIPQALGADYQGRSLICKAASGSLADSALVLAK